MSLTPNEILERATTVLADEYELWLASNGAVLARLDLAPGGIPLTPLDFLGPYERAWKLEDLMRVYNMLNAASFGPKGIPLQNWVMIDLGLLPSAFLLITMSLGRAQRLSDDPRLEGPQGERTREVLTTVLAEADRLGYDGPIPVAGYCAAPTPDRDAWVGWSLCSAIPGLGTIAKGLALLAYGARSLTGVAQFYDPALRVHRKFGPMQVLAAVLDLHPVLHTMAYRTDVFASEPTDPAQTTPTVMLDPRDYAAQRELQRKLDAGTHELFILPPGLANDRVPILERS